MKKLDFKTVTCKNCKRVSMGVTEKYAKEEVASFNKFYKTLSPSRKKDYGRKASIDSYKCCHNMDLRREKKVDCPDGVTLGPVIWEKPEKKLQALLNSIPPGTIGTSNFIRVFQMSERKMEAGKEKDDLRSEIEGLK